MSHVADNQAERLFTIGQVTALTGVGRSTLRHWEREFHEFLDSVRTDGNQRRFTPDAVDRIEKIRELVEDHGLTLRGVKKRLDTLQESDLENPLPQEVETGETSEQFKMLADLMSDHIMKRLFGHNRNN
jgi:DNA-binding transcriptional MerR regulator